MGSDNNAIRTTAQFLKEPRDRAHGLWVKMGLGFVNQDYPERSWWLESEPSESLCVVCRFSQGLDDLRPSFFGCDVSSFKEPARCREFSTRKAYCRSHPASHPGAEHLAVDRAFGILLLESD